MRTFASSSAVLSRSIFFCRNSGEVTPTPASIHAVIGTARRNPHPVSCSVDTSRTVPSEQRAQSWAEAPQPALVLAVVRAARLDELPEALRVVHDIEVGDL